MNLYYISALTTAKSLVRYYNPYDAIDSMLNQEQIRNLCIQIISPL